MEYLISKVHFCIILNFKVAIIQLTLFQFQMRALRTNAKIMPNVSLANVLTLANAVQNLVEDDANVCG